MPQPATQKIDLAIGDNFGLRIPAHGEALRLAGAEFLTSAFRAFGALSPENSVARIRKLERCDAGSTGEAFFLSLTYACPEPDLHDELFVKFSRDFNNLVRDERGKFEMEGEVRFARLSRDAGFPIPVPKPYFADYHAQSHTGMLITERIAFGRGRIEAQHGKCQDHLLADPLTYYRLIIDALAKVAAFHRQNAAAIDGLLPYDPGRAALSLGIADGADVIESKLWALFAFVEQCPQLFPPEIADRALFKRIALGATRLVREQERVAEMLTAHHKMIGLCHWNANIDNCWFWRDEADRLRCGLLDWGNAGQINLAFSLWGCLSGAPLSIWREHLDELLASFISAVRSNGGGGLDPDRLRTHLDLYMAIMGLSYFIDSPARLIDYSPGIAQASGPLDPLIAPNDRVRNQLHMLTNVLDRWRLNDISASLDRLARFD